jgi:hypothetical protein
MLMQVDYSAMMHWGKIFGILRMFIGYYHEQSLTFIEKTITKRY